MACMYKLREWIPVEKLNWEFISTFPTDTHYQLIASNMDKIDWEMICFNTNPDVIKLFCDHMEDLSMRPDKHDYLHEKKKKLNWYQLSKQPAAISFLETNLDKVVWSSFQMNPAAIHILRFNMDKLDYEYICRNPAAIELIENIDMGDGMTDWWKCWLGSISKNPNALHLFEKNLDCISWLVSNLKHNPEAIHLLRKHKDKIKWHLVDIATVCQDPIAIQLVEINQPGIDWNNNPHTMQYRNCIDWIDLSFNSGAIHLLEANLDKVNWDMLSMNPNAIQLLEANPDKISWGYLSCNPNAMHLLEANLDKIDWMNLSSNTSAIKLLEANLDKVDWNLLSGNSEAIHILEANTDKVEWNWLSHNLNIMQYDYEFMRLSKETLHEELISFIYHPDKINKWIHMYGMEKEYLE